MIQNDVKTITDYLDEYEPDITYALRLSYSGKGMYGSTTIGLVVDTSKHQLLNPLQSKLSVFWDEGYDEDDIDALEEEYDKLENFLTVLFSARQDSMGLNFIWY